MPEIQEEWMSGNHYLDSCMALNINYINQLFWTNNQSPQPHSPTPRGKGVHCPGEGLLLGFQAKSDDVDVSGQTNEIQTCRPGRANSHSSSHMCHFTFTNPLTT